jgi:uncharacterized protein
MTSPIFLDVNIPMYAAGAPHPLREPCIEALRIVAARPREFWTDAEVLQEILHRYQATNRWPLGGLIFQKFAELMRDRIESVTATDVVLAAQLAGRLARLGARDLLHLAVMQRVGADTIVSADRGFDRAPGIRRLDPAEVAAWRNEVVR